jgi:hypothetical protein
VPITTPVRPYAARALLVSWAASSAVPAKTSPTAASPTPSATESATASGNATRLSVTSVPTRRLASTTTTIVAAVVASRPTGEARSSSSRPFSSSARVCRTTRNIDMRPTVTAPNAVACQVTWPPTVLSARAGPAIATNAALDPISAAARSSSAWVA